MTQPTICTIIAKNYLASARCLTGSFLEQHPDGRVFVLLIDEPDGYFDPAQEDFTAVSAKEIGIKNYGLMVHRYSVLELSTAVKPFFLEYLFRQYACRQLCYFDPDIYFYQPITEIWDLLNSYSIVLTPHLLDFLDEKFAPDELSIMQSGCYNLGFIGLSETPDLYRFLRWWQQKLDKHCIVDFDQGLFVDQRWIDLVPGFFSDVCIHRDPGCNVAYWNLNHRHIRRENGLYLVNGAPLKFFHFSGFSPVAPNILSKYQNRFTFDDLPHLKPLFEDYRECLQAQGYAESQRWPYTYNYYPNLNIRVPKAARGLWREWEKSHPLAEMPDISSFEQMTRDFLSWLNEPVDTPASSEPIITRLALAIHQERPDLQQAYPDVLGEHRWPFIKWFLAWSKTVYGLDDFFLEPMRASTTRAPASLRGIGPRFYTGLVSWLFKFGAGPWLERKLGEKVIGPVRRLFVPGGTPGQPANIKAGSAKPVTGKRDRKADLGLNVAGYLCDETGVGEVARASIKALHAQGFPVAYTLVTSEAPRKNDRSALQLPRGNPYHFNCLYVNADQLKFVHDTDLGVDFFRDKYNIGFWNWELNRFPEEWLDRFNYLDEVWVASNFVQNALADVSPIPVITLGAPVEKRPDPHLSRRELGLPEDKFLFLFAFDMLSYIERKNPFGLIEAYRRAFGERAKDNQLIIKVTNLDRFPEHQQALEQAVESVSGILLDGYLDRDILNGLFHAADAYVSLHRSEGFGMTIAEAMSLGKPTIATAYSSNVDFMNAANSYPVGYRLIELQESYGPYKKGEVWADPDLDQAAAYMRQVFEKPEEAVRLGQQAAADIQLNYSGPAIANRIITRLKNISSRFA